LTKLKVSLVFFAVETKERKKERQTETERERGEDFIGVILA
jgi:hypothetical protein